jgi:hypothetical protein
MAWLTGWRYRKKITIDETKVDADLTDFPVLVKLTSSNFDFTKALSNGNDIRFTSSDGSTLLKYERERHDATNQVAEYWVKIPSVSGSVNTDFYIYFGNVSASDGADPTNVWDNNFKGVWHMKDYTTSQVNDSTANANNGTKKAANEPIETDGKIAKGQNFDRVDDYISISAPNIDYANFTLEAFVKPNTLGSSSNNPEIFFFVNSDGSLVSLFGINYQGKIMWYVKKTGNIQRRQRTTTTPITAGNWYYLVLTKSGDNDVVVYKDAVVDTTRENQTEDTAFSNNYKIGGVKDIYNELWDGIIDEVRISNIQRSAAWIKASYHSGNDTLVSYGIEEALAAGRSQGFIF